MDSSNSTQITSLDYALHGLCLEAADISAEDWLAILKKVVERVKPQLQYMEGFCRIERPSDVWDNSEYTRQLRFSAPVPERVLCRLMTSRICWVPISGWSPRLEAYLYLDRDGRWIDIGRTLHSNDPRPYWQYVDEPYLLELLRSTNPNRSGQLGYRMLSSIVQMVRETVKEREERLQRMQILQGYLGTLKDRVCG